MFGRAIRFAVLVAVVIPSGTRPLLAQVPRPTPASLPESKFVTLNSLRLHYLEWPRSNAPTMLLIPGLGGGGGSVWQFVPFAEAMNARFHIVAFEPRGCGESEWAKENSWQLAINDIDAAINALKLAPVTLVGHSSGATWTLLYASAHPDKVASVIAVEPGARAPGTFPAYPIFSSQQDAFELAKTRWKTNSSVDDAVRQWVEHGTRQTGPARWEWRNDPEARLQGLPTPEQYRAQLPHVSAPTLVVAGAEAHIVKESDVRLMKNARLVTVPDAGHVVHLANPQAFLAAVDEFLSSIADPQSAFASTAPTDLLRAVQQRAQAEHTRDLDTFSRMTTDDFTLTRQTGEVLNKSQRIEQLRTGPVSTKPPPTTEEKIRVFNGDAALRSRRVVRDGKPIRMLTVWVKQDAQWKVAATQVTADQGGTVGRDVSYLSGNETVHAMLYTPPGAGPFPALIAIHPVGGLSDWVKQQASKFADAGYLTLAVDLYRGKTASESDGTTYLAEAQEIARTAPPTRRERDLQAAYEFLAQQPNVAKDRIGAIGWCMGGSLAIRLAVLQPDLKVAVAHYPTGVPKNTDDLSRIHAATFLVLGGKDPAFTLDKANDFEKQMKTLGKPIEKVVYPDAGHAFEMPWSTQGYRQEDTADAWQKTISFLNTTLATTSAAAPANSAPTKATVEVLAGTGAPGVPANEGQPATQVELADPAWLFRGPDGTLYFDEPSQNRVRGFKVGGRIRVVAGNGDRVPQPDVKGAVANQVALGNIDGGDIDPDANLAFLDAYAHTRIVVVDLSTGRVLLAAGSPGGTETGTANAVRMGGIGAVCLGQSAAAGQNGVMFFLDVALQRVRRLTYSFDPTTRTLTGATVDSIAGAGGGAGFDASGPALKAKIRLGLTSGCVYAPTLKKLLFAQNFNRVIVSVDFPNGPDSAPGDLAVVAGRPGAFPTTCRDGEGGLATDAAINPNALAFDADTSEFYVSSGALDCVRRFRIGGAITTVVGIGKPGDETVATPATTARMSSPRGLTFDSKTKTLYIAASGSRRIVRMHDGILDSIAGTGPSGGLLTKPTPARSANLGAIDGGAVASDGSIFVTDTLHSVLNRVDPSGQYISRFAGTGLPAPDDSEDRLAATTIISRPRDVATDERGNIYIVETGSQIIRRIDANGRIHLFAGSPGNVRARGKGNGDGGPATSARLANPDAITYCPETKAIYFHEDGLIRRIDRKGTITTIAGSAEFGAPRNDMDSPDGTPAAQALIAGASGRTRLWVDGRAEPETVYFSEGRKIKKFQVGGAIVTVGGTDGRGSDDDNIPATAARFIKAMGIVGDRDGNIYVADRNRVRKIDRSGTITTVAGPEAGWTSLGSLQLDPQGRLVAFDEGTNRIFRVSLPGPVSSGAVAAANPSESSSPVGPPTGGQERANAGSSLAEQEILAAEGRAWDSAMNGDFDTMADMLDDSYVGISSTGTGFGSKATAVENYRSGKIKILSQTFTERRVRLLGDAAIVTAIWNAEFPREGGKSEIRHIRFTHVWAKRNGAWKIVSWQGTEITNRSAPEAGFEACADPDAPVAPGSVEETILKLQDEHSEATRNSDAARGTGWLADEYIGINGSGRLFEKAGVAALYRPGLLKYRVEKYGGRRVRVYGDTAILTGTWCLRQQREGQRETTGANRITRVWVKRNGKWEVVSWQGTPVPPSPNSVAGNSDELAPWFGTWKINLAKSKLVDANGNEHPMDFRDSVIVIQPAGDQIKLIDDDTPTSGPATHFEWIGKFDGRDYPASGDAGAVTYAYKPVTDRHQLFMVKNGGKVLATRDITLSADGNTRIMSGVRGDGTHVIAVYEKQGVERSAKENLWFGTWVLNGLKNGQYE